MEKAWLADEVVRAKKAIERDESIHRILIRQDMVDWCNGLDYDRPTKFIPLTKKCRKGFAEIISFILP